MRAAHRAVADGRGLGRRPGRHVVVAEGGERHRPIDAGRRHVLRARVQAERHGRAAEHAGPVQDVPEQHDGPAPAAAPRRAQVLTTGRATDSIFVFPACLSNP